MEPTATAGLRDSADALRSAAFELLEELRDGGFSEHADLSVAVVRMQSVTNHLGAITELLDLVARRERIPLSQDGAIVLGLAATAVPFATSFEDEAERWLRVLRLYGQVGAVLQALGVPEGPLTTEARETSPSEAPPERRDDAVAKVSEQAQELTRRRGGPTVDTVDVLFAVFALYGGAFERALYVRGTSRAEVIECLCDKAGASVG
jgi:hypothetical protein